MIGISLTFLTHRYHATPWGRHVNEGAVEWPPSPWRLLRAWIAVWHQKVQGFDEALMSALIEKLAQEHPHFQLPQVGVGHTRHYMPRIKGRLQTPNLIFDSFVRFFNKEDAKILAFWPESELKEQESLLLERLCQQITWLGRAESWVEARLLNVEEAITHYEKAERQGELVSPTEDAFPQLGQQRLRVLCSVRKEAYESFCQERIAQREAQKRRDKEQKAIEKGKDPKKVKLSQKERDTLRQDLPERPYDALQLATSELRQAGWSQPPASKWVDYDLPVDALDGEPLLRRVRHASVEKAPTVARFVVASQVLPRLTMALSVGERIHRALVKISDGAPVFLGKDHNDQLLEGHRHAHIFPESNDEGRGLITHVTVVAKGGFDRKARQSLERLRRVWGHEGHDLQLVLLGMGGPEAFAGWDERAGQCVMLESSRVWQSRTPFLATRHPKATRKGVPKLDPQTGWQKGSAIHDLHRLILAQGLPEPEGIEPIPSTLLGSREQRWLAFHSQRRTGKGRRGAQSATGFRITFPTPIQGPLAFGYGAHFGMGYFVPVQEEH